MQIPSKLKPLFEDPHRHNIIEGGRGGGKTRTIPSLIVDVMADSPLAVICAREVQKSLKESSFRAIENEIYRQGKASLFNITRDSITSKAGGRITFIGLLSHTADSMKSYEDYHWAWVEEAQSVSKDSLDILIPTLRTDGYFKHKDYIFPLRMFIYTMNPYSWDDQINTVLPESREDTQRITINYTDNPWFPKSLEEERKEAKKIMHPDEYNRIWEGIPYEDSERAVMSRSAIEAAQKRKVSEDGGVVVGADIARFGTDKTVFIKRRGLQMVDKKVLIKQDTQEVARQLKDFCEGGRIVVDDTGVGGGVTDKLRDLGCTVTAINFGGKAKQKKKYPDIISEMWFDLADQIEDIGMIPDVEMVRELSSRNFKYTNDERRKVESKEEYKKRTGRKSPDTADAVILCYYTRKNGYTGEKPHFTIG
jgi:phage terminase large subunit